MKKHGLEVALLAIALAFVLTISAAADGGSPFGPIVKPDGSVDVSGLTDLGLQDVPVDWIPNVAGVGGVAEYHLYQDPQTGTIYQIPTPVTYAFMAANPEKSGLNASVGALSGNAENSTGYVTDVAFLAGIMTGNQTVSDYTGFLQAGYSSWNEFFQAVVDGKANVWELPAEDTLHFLTTLATLSLTNGDNNFYTVVIAYSPGACAKLPGGCPANVNLTAGQTVINVPAQCSAPFTTTGPIVIGGGPGAGDGGKIAPLHPIVVGQDPQRRGVDISVQASIPPIIYHYYEAVPATDQVCIQDNINGTFGTGCTPTNKRFRLVTRHYYECIAHTRSYADQMASATVSLSLTQESRQWILVSLEQSYPGAHLLHPDFSFSVPGPGTENSDTVTWSHIFAGIPVQDPGNWTVSVHVTTTGTAVSGPRFATQGLGTFLDELVRVTLVSGMGGIQP